MKPSYVSGDVLHVSKFRKPRVGDVVVARDPRDGRLLLKRVGDFVGDKVFISGDNAMESTDSRTFGYVQERDIIGKVVRIKK